MWATYQELVSSSRVREYLGVSAEEWENLPAVFTDWAVQFYRLEQRRAGNGRPNLRPRAVGADD